jgi:hypothetical protein
MRIATGRVSARLLDIIYRFRAFRPFHVSKRLGWLAPLGIGAVARPDERQSLSLATLGRCRIESIAHAHSATRAGGHPEMFYFIYLPKKASTFAEYRPK